jgi:hypothetical protein
MDSPLSPVEDSFSTFSRRTFGAKKKQVKSKISKEEKAPKKQKATKRKRKVEEANASPNGVKKEKKLKADDPLAQYLEQQRKFFAKVDSLELVNEKDVVVIKADTTCVAVNTPDKEEVWTMAKDKKNRKREERRLDQLDAEKSHLSTSSANKSSASATKTNNFKTNKSNTIITPNKSIVSSVSSAPRTSQDTAESPIAVIMDVEFPALVMPELPNVDDILVPKIQIPKVSKELQDKYPQLYADYVEYCNAVGEFLEPILFEEFLEQNNVYE